MSRTNNLTPSRVLATSIVVCLPFAAVACGGDKKAEKKQTAAATATPTPAVDVPDIKLPAIPVVGKAEGARADVEAGDCPTARGSHTVKGTVKNPTKSAADYAITVSWVTERSDVRARKSVIIKRLRPGKSKRWSIKAKVRTDDVSQCAFFVERGSYRGS